MKALSIATALLMSSQLVAAHFKIINATGNNGGNASALGVLAGDNSQSDCTHFKRRDDTKGGNLFGTLISGEQVDLAKSISTLQQKNPTIQFPQVSRGGILSMFIRQLNGDGAGPVNCTVSLDATGLGVFTNTTMILDVPGSHGISGENNKNFPLVIKMPDLPCTGTVGSLSSVCVVQCQNEIQFGGNVVVQMVGGAGNSSMGNSTAQVVKRAKLNNRIPDSIAERAPEPTEPISEAQLAERAADRRDGTGTGNSPTYEGGKRALVKRYSQEERPEVGPDLVYTDRLAKQAAPTVRCGGAVKDSVDEEARLPAVVTAPPQAIVADVGVEILTMLTVTVTVMVSEVGAEAEPTPTVPSIDKGSLELRKLPPSPIVTFTNNNE